MRTESEMAAAHTAHMKKYPLKLGGMPIEDWFELKAQEEAQRKKASGRRRLAQ